MSRVTRPNVTPISHSKFPCHPTGPCHPNLPIGGRRKVRGGTGRSPKPFCDTGKRVPGYAARLSSLWIVNQSFVCIARTSGVTRPAPESAQFASEMHPNVSPDSRRRYLPVHCIIQCHDLGCNAPQRRIMRLNTPNCVTRIPRNRRDCARHTQLCHPDSRSAAI